MCPGAVQHACPIWTPSHRLWHCGYEGKVIVIAVATAAAHQTPTLSRYPNPEPDSDPDPAAQSLLSTSSTASILAAVALASAAQAGARGGDGAAHLHAHSTAAGRDALTGLLPGSGAAGVTAHLLVLCCLFAAIIASGSCSCRLPALQCVASLALRGFAVPWACFTFVAVSPQGINNTQ